MPTSQPDRSQPSPQDRGTAERAVIVLAAGLGKRMRSSTPKVLHQVLGRSLLGHVLAAADPLQARRTMVVVGAGADAVKAHLAEVAPAAEAVFQAEQRGTGHATRVAVEQAPEASGTVVVLTGDTPLLRPDTLAELVRTHEELGFAATVLTAAPEDPSGLGRIIRDAEGRVTGIVEERDATPEQRAVREINSGIIAFQAPALRAVLGRLSADNDQGEEYLTDTIGLLVAEGLPVGSYVAVDPVETLGCNDRAQLARMGALLRDRVNEAWLRSGVTMVDPSSAWIDVTVTVGVDAVLEPNVQLRGSTTVGVGATVGPDSTLVDTEVGAGASVVRAHAQSAVVGPECSVGPFAYLRPGTRLHRGAKVGTYVETKNAEIGAGSKVPHLSYVGDATIGEHANIGAATIFVNYDGVRKHHSVVGDAAFVGCDSMLVAPVRIGDGSYVAAGSVVYRNVGPGQLGVTRAQQRNIDGWVERQRAGTRSAAAAARARELGATNPTRGSAGAQVPAGDGQTAARSVPDGAAPSDGSVAGVQPGPTVEQ
ncbi:MAG: bifunctional UDP-N-acetylglucosamine diphosphorylase/glucosamine-1-phosphate N-acetyltransferase GlmU [Actinocatenispora sp.]